MYQLTKTDQFVTRLQDGCQVPTTDPDSADYQAYLAWCLAGGVALPVEPAVLSPAQSIAALQAGVQARLDAFAKTRYYDDIGSAASYAGDDIPRFNSDGMYCKKKRSETWAVCYQVLGEVEAGKRPIPTQAELDALLPPLQWPA